MEDPLLLLLPYTKAEPLGVSKRASLRGRSHTFVQREVPLGVSDRPAKLCSAPGARATPAVPRLHPIWVKSSPPPPLPSPLPPLPFFLLCAKPPYAPTRLFQPAVAGFSQHNSPLHLMQQPQLRLRVGRIRLLLLATSAWHRNAFFHLRSVSKTKLQNARPLT